MSFDSETAKSASARAAAVRAARAAELREATNDLLARDGIAQPTRAQYRFARARARDLLDRPAHEVPPEPPAPAEEAPAPQMVVPTTLISTKPPRYPPGYENAVRRLYREAGAALDAYRDNMELQLGWAEDLNVDAAKHARNRMERELAEIKADIDGQVAAQLSTLCRLYGVP